MSNTEKELVAMCNSRSIARKMMRNYALFWRAYRNLRRPASGVLALELAVAFREKAKVLE